MIADSQCSPTVVEPMLPSEHVQNYGELTAPVPQMPVVDNMPHIPPPPYQSPPVSPLPYHVTQRSRSFGSRSPMLIRQNAIKRGSSGSLESPQTPKSTLSVPSEVLGVNIRGLVPTSMAYSSVPNVQRSTAERPTTLFHHSQPALYTSGRTPTRSVFTFQPQRGRSPPSPLAVQMDTFAGGEDSDGSDQDLLNAHTVFEPRADPTPQQSAPPRPTEDEEDEGVFVHEWEEECDAEVEKITSEPEWRQQHAPSPYEVHAREPVSQSHMDLCDSRSQTPPAAQPDKTSPVSKGVAVTSPNSDTPKDLCSQPDWQAQSNNGNSFQPANLNPTQDVQQTGAAETQGAVTREQGVRDQGSSWSDQAGWDHQTDAFPQSQSPLHVVIISDDSGSEKASVDAEQLQNEDEGCRSRDSALTQDVPTQFRVNKDAGSLYVSVEPHQYQYGGDDFV